MVGNWVGGFKGWAKKKSEKLVEIPRMNVINITSQHWLYFDFLCINFVLRAHSFMY